MARKIAVANQKGGVGKTDLCVNLSTALALKGRRVLLVDLDPQHHSSDYLNVLSSELSTYELLMQDDVGLRDIVKATEIEGLYVAPSSLSLGAARLQLVGDVNMQFKLKRKLTNDYDYVFIDTPPSLGVLTINALTAADEVLIPIQTHYLAMAGVSKLLSTIDAMKEDLNKNLKICGMVLTMFDRRTRLSFEVEEKVREAFRDKVLKTVIPINVRLAEAPSHRKPIIKYAPRSTSAKAYGELAEELLK